MFTDNHENLTAKARRTRSFFLSLRSSRLGGELISHQPVAMAVLDSGAEMFRRIGSAVPQEAI